MWAATLTHRIVPPFSTKQPKWWLLWFEYHNSVIETNPHFKMSFARLASYKLHCATLSPTRGPKCWPIGQSSHRTILCYMPEPTRLSYRTISPPCLWTIDWTTSGWSDTLLLGKVLIGSTWNCSSPTDSPHICWWSKCYFHKLQTVDWRNREVSHASFYCLQLILVNKISPLGSPVKRKKTKFTGAIF